jgi:hypothetical protein
VLRFVHSGMLGDDWGDDFAVMSGHGWDMYLRTLGEYMKHFASRPATYVAADAPPSSVPAERWPTLLRALGIADDVAVGDQVRLTPGGIAPIDGVVGYHQPTFFFGVRSADALYRFHGRWPLGMPVAVGHHLYADGVDQQEQAKAWEAWLAKAFA